MKKNMNVRGLFAGAGALVTALALTLGGGVAAQADDLPTTSDIVITKLSTPPTGPGAAATGLAIGAAGGPVLPTGTTPIAGVMFEAYAVPLPGTPAPGTNAWQQAVAAMNLADAQAAVGGSPVDASSFASTGTDGVTTWANAPRGLYLIREVSAPNGVTPAGDFLVAVPLTNPENLNDWLDTIYVYPKNSKVSVTKTIDEGSSVAVGGVVNYTILADIPRDETISSFVITDTFDARLAPLNGLPNAITVNLTGTTAAPIAATDYSVDVTGQVVTVTFTPQGLLALVAAWQIDPTARVELGIPTEVLGGAMNQANTADAAILNAAVLSVNDATPLASTPVTLKVGDIKITKLNAADNAALAGAEFSVYRTESDAANRVNPIVINGATVFTTGVTGDLTISGLLFSDYVNGVSVTDDDQDDADAFREYWINEVKSPTGFQLLAAPIFTPVTAAGTDVASINVLNTPNTNGFVLPLTGGMGTALLTVGGIAILATVLLLARRRRETEAHAE